MDEQDTAETTEAAEHAGSDGRRAELLGRTVPVLDHGFVRLIDWMGDDRRVVQAARVSYGEGTKTYREDQGLINYLVRNQHNTPIEQCRFTFHAKMPIFVARQWIRHRMSSTNEVSGRYSVLPEEVYIPDAADLNPQSQSNRQGRDDAIFKPEEISELQREIQIVSSGAFTSYHYLLGEGLAREVARIVLPLNTYTEWYWSIDLHNLLHFLGLRLDAHAQKEIRVYAEAIAGFVREICPMVWSAFEEYRLGAVTFSRTEAGIIEGIVGCGYDRAALISYAQHAGMSKGQATEFAAKVLP